MKNTYWKIVFTAACLLLAAGAMVLGRNAEASEQDAPDETGPSVCLQMEDGNYYDGMYYYREDNCALVALVQDEESALESFELVVGQTVFDLSDCKITGNHSCRIKISAKQMSELVSRDGMVSISARAKDAAGNQTVLAKGADVELKGLSFSGEAAEFVLDRTAPAVTLTAADQEGMVYYQVTADDGLPVVNCYQPFRQEETSELRIWTEDLSPTKLSYEIGSSLDGQARIRSDTEWGPRGKRIVREQLYGQQSFWIENFSIKDRAGNSFVLGKSNPLFLDAAAPSVDISMPEPAAIASKEITRSCPDGRSLYQTDVTFLVTVSDYDQNREGAGLQDVHCSVRVNGAESDQGVTYVSRLEDCLPDAPEFTLPDHIVYGDDPAILKCRSSYQGTITVPAGDVFESNDIEVIVTAVDNAGNRSDPDSGGRVRFGIDSEGPLVEVAYDNQDVQNDIYFKDMRTATIRVTDRNVDSNKIAVHTQADMPAGFEYATDQFLKQIVFQEDGEYTLQISGTDALGNPLRQEVQYLGVAPDHFVIDRTAPKVRFEQVESGRAYRETIAPRVVFEDKNFSEELVSLALTGKRKKDRRELLPDFTPAAAGGGINVVNGGSFQMQNIAVTKINDDIYTARAKIRDLAGNEAEQAVEFSVNRFGSTYDYNKDQSTEGFLETYYSNNEQNLFLREININHLTSHRITVYQDGVNRVLKQGSDYRLHQKEYGGARQYIYEIFAENFVQEGVYDISVQSQDEAGNTNSNRADRHHPENGEVALKFVIDKTPPQIMINGVSIQRSQVFTDDRKIQITPRDNMRFGKITIALQGSKSTNETSENEEPLYFSFDPENGEKQTLKIEACDAAGNVSSGTLYYKKPERKRTAFKSRRDLTEEKTSKHLGWLIVACTGAVGILLIIIKLHREKM